MNEFNIEGNATCEVAMPSPNKARELYNAIGRIDEVIGRISGLCERIATGGEDCKANEATAIDPHTFASLMNNGSNEIDKKVFCNARKDCRD